MNYVELSPGWDEVSVLLPGWNGLYWKFTGLEWILLEIHRAGTTFTGNTLADMNLLEESPGCYARIFVEIHRAGTDPSQSSPGCNGFNKSPPGCNGFNCRITGLFWVYPYFLTSELN